LDKTKTVLPQNKLTNTLKPFKNIGQNILSKDYTSHKTKPEQEDRKAENAL